MSSAFGYINTPMQKPKKCTIQQIEDGTCFDDDPKSRRVTVDGVRPCENGEKKCYKIVLSVRGKRKKQQAEHDHMYHDEDYDLRRSR
mgnify:CR=1 FL=1